MDGPSLDDMRLLAAVVEHGSFSRAAARSGTTQPRVSRAIQRLEERLGVPLVRRSSRHVAPTSAGRRLAEHAQRLLAEVAQVEAQLRAPGAIAGPLSVSAPPAVGRRLLAPRLGAFCRAHPDVRLELSLESRRVDLIGGGVDVAIRFGPLPDSRLHARRVFAGAYHVYGAPAFAEVRDLPEALGDLPCLVLDATHLRDRWPFVRASTMQWVPVSPILSSDDVETLIRLAVDGLGVTMAPDFLVRDEVERGALVRLTKPSRAVPAEVFALTDPQRGSEAARALVKHLTRRRTQSTQVAGSQPPSSTAS